MLGGWPDDFSELEEWATFSVIATVAPALLPSCESDILPAVSAR